MNEHRDIVEEVLDKWIERLAEADFTAFSSTLYVVVRPELSLDVPFADFA